MKSYMNYPEFKLTVTEYGKQATHMLKLRRKVIRFLAKT